MTVAPNATLAARYYRLASERTGNADAQHKLAFLYASNYDKAVSPLDAEGQGHQGSALLHYTFAALARDMKNEAQIDETLLPHASMAVGYRHWAGIGTRQSCKDALGWYKAAADHCE